MYVILDGDVVYVKPITLEICVQRGICMCKKNNDDLPEYDFLTLTSLVPGRRNCISPTTMAKESQPPPPSLEYSTIEIHAV